ncbi:hypothetical protein MC7420_6520 [Coleofasciculus chthonoplastes PCC 7420]|uniref:Uncharacterized protein n=1 Tax=Coleofasciculus chthonoplastes PCC 7420 TaxID=118168 RepID=B4VQK9_9CYAN|nr:hypothetical protein MC7420_6520 [Coleofasciculus chthonoplastes PCC 7420]
MISLPFPGLSYLLLVLAMVNLGISSVHTYQRNSEAGIPLPK